MIFDLTNNTHRNLHQTVSYVLRAVILFCAIIALSSCANKKTSLTNEEQLWLKNNAENIVTPFGYSAPPNAFYNDNGEYVGLLLDFKKEIEKGLQTEFENKYFDTWTKLINYAENTDNYIIIGIARTAEREKYLNFTNSFIKIPYVIIARKDSKIKSMNDLGGKNICAPKEYAVIDYVQQNYSNLKVSEVDNDLDALRGVSSGLYDVAIVSQMYSTFIIENKGYTNLKYAGESGYHNRLCAAVSNKNPELYKIIDKAVDQISIKTQKKLYRKWIYQMPQNISRIIIYAILILTSMTLFIVFILWLWLSNLRKQVSKTTNIIRQNEERYRSLIENSNDAIYILQKYKFVLVNNRFEKLFLYTKEELLDANFNFTNLVAPESRAFIEQRNHSILNHIEVPYNYEFVGLTKAGKKLHLEASVNFLNQDNGIATQGILHDITDRKIKEIELLNAKEKAEESDRLKSAFLANMSHEIRTPMNGILGFADLLKSQKYSPVQQNNFIGIIQKSGERMLATINNIIDISKIESGVETVQRNEVNIRLLINELYSFFLPETKQRGIELLLNLPSSTINDVFFTDEYKLNSILTNLVKNAIKFTPEGSITIGYSFSSSHINIEVIDTGTGIAKEKQNSIFDYFVQANVSTTRGYEGSGLGLSITKGYVNMLAGDIRIESEPEYGTSFFISIPVGPRQIEMETQLPSPNKEIVFGPSNLKIIVVEDDAISAQFLGLILSEISSTIIFAKNGIETVELLKKHPDTNIVLMDMKMPKMGGLEATEQIRKFNDEVFIIAQTAFAKDGYREKALSAGCNEFLLKPLNKIKVHEIIASNFPSTKL